MREIKFRFWYEGKLTLLDEMFVGVNQLGFSDVHYVDLNDNDHENAIIMQYTGLKDKNGVEIYEGDIVVYTDKQSQIKITSNVTFDKVLAQFGIDKGEDDGSVWTIWGDSPNMYEVIGNIYENPELING